MAEWMYNPHFLDLGTSWSWVVSFAPLVLYPRGKIPQYPLDRRLGGPQSWSGRHGEVKILAPTGTQTPTSGHPACSQSLYQPHYPGKCTLTKLWDKYYNIFKQKMQKNNSARTTFFLAICASWTDKIGSVYLLWNRHIQGLAETKTWPWNFLTDQSQWVLCPRTTVKTLFRFTLCY
jgi:hypothetical protein